MENCHKPYIWKHDVCKLFPEKKNRLHVLYHMYISLIAEASHLAR